MKSIFGAVLGGGLGIATFVGYSAGFFNEIKIEDKKINEKRLVYFEHEGNYQELGPIFKKLITDSQPFMKIRNVYRITYDDPYTIQDVAKLRSIVGLEYDNLNDENGAKLLIKEKKDYKLATLPETQAICSIFKMKQKNFNVAFLMIKFRLYPAIEGYIGNKIQTDKGFKLNTEHRMVEIYKFDEKKSPYEIEFNVPTGENSDKYNIHSKPTPKYAQVK